MTTYVPITREMHGEKTWVRHTSLAFAKNDTVAPLYANELAAALQAMPIAFIKTEEGFSLVVVLGLEPGKNLFVSGNGSWLANYLPVVYRGSPFELMSVRREEYLEDILCIDEACITKEDEGHPFFNEDGSASEGVSTALEQVQQLYASRQLTQLVCAALAEHQLLTPWSITLNYGDKEVAVNGLYQIDEAALGLLSEEAFISLRKIGALPVAYSQLLSMININVLIELMKRPELYVEPKSSSEKRTTETFNFSGL